MWILLIVVVTSIWVYFDAKKIGVKKGQLKGVCDLGVGGWFAVCLFLWIVGFPAYLIKRPELKKINQEKTHKAGIKKCPYCAEEIQLEAIKCKHCAATL